MTLSTKAPPLCKRKPTPKSAGQSRPKAPKGRMASLLAESEKLNGLTADHRQARHNATCVKRFIESQGISSAHDITRLSIQRHLTHLAESGLSPKTVRNHQTALSCFCTFLTDQKILADNPCYRLRTRKLEKLPPLFLDDSECEQALEIARKHHIFGEVCLALNTGMRLAELRNLKWKDIDWDARTLLVRRSKSKRPRTIPLNEKALSTLRGQQEKFGAFPFVFPGGNPDPSGDNRHQARWGPRKMEWWTTKALKPLRAKIAKFSQMPPGSVGRGFHLFRHTFASRAVKAGVSIFLVSKWLGHAHVTTTEIYAHLSGAYHCDIERV